MATPALDDVGVVPGSSDDLDAVMTIMESAFGDRFGEAWTRSQLSGILPMTGVELWLVQDRASNEVFGFSLSRTVVEEAELLLIAVHSLHHRRGAGRKLLDHFLATASSAGVSRVHLEVRDGNPAMAMYYDAGFDAVGRRTNYYLGSDGQRYDAITLGRQL
jgi:ribosomal-protein-alanine N-acetyltransferase